MLTSFWSNLAPATAVPTAAQNAAATTPAAFASWPTAVQASFLKANGIGSPPSLVVGAGGDRILAKLGTDGTTVTTTPMPADYGTAPSQVTLAQFSAWADPIQALYVSTYGAGSPASLALGGLVPTADPGAGAFTATLSADGSYATTVGSAAMQTANVEVTGRAAIPASGPDPGSAAIAGTSPAAMTAQTFFALPADEQATYVTLHSPASATFGPLAIDGASATAGDPTITVRSGGYSYGVLVPASSYPGYADPVSNGTSATITSFASWPEPVQAAYLAANGVASPAGRAVCFPNAAPAPGLTATLGKNGTGVSLSPTPAGFSTSASAGLDAFLSWPAAEQAIFVAAQIPQPFGQITLSNAAAQTATVHRTGGSDFTVVPSAAAAGAAPGSMDPMLFGLLTSAQQLDYFGVNAAGQPPSVTIGAGAGRVLLTQSGAGQLQLEVYPSGFDTPPASLDPSTFLAWDTAFRLLYAAKNGTGSPPGVVIGSGSGAVSVGMPTVNGATITTFSPIPYYTMPGASSGVTSPINDLTAGTVFPILDGSGGSHNVTPLPADFGMAPSALSASEFTGWNSGVQLQYLAANATAGQTLPIGSGSDRVDVFAQTAGLVPGAIPKVYVVQNLQKGDVATMSLADQRTLAASAAFSGIVPPATASLAQGLGLIPDYQGTPAPTGATAPAVGTPVMVGTTIYGGDMPDPNAGLTSALTATQTKGATLSAFGYVQQMFTTALNTIKQPGQTSPALLPGAVGSMSADDVKVFTDEVDLLRRQTFGPPPTPPTPFTAALQASGQAIFSPKDIQDKLTAIITRFKRAYAFSTPSIQYAGHYEVSSITYTQTYGGRYTEPYSETKTNSGTSDVNDFLSYWSKYGLTLTPQAKGNVGGTETESPSLPTVTDQANGLLSFSTIDVTSVTYAWHAAATTPPDSNSVSQGYKTFMAQEKTILSLANRADQLAGSGTLAGTQQQLDVPNLVYLFQLFSNLTGEAVLRADTEEVNQTNELLNEYAVMQKIINQTVAKIPPQNDSKYTPTSALQGSNPDGTLTDSEQAIMAMFTNQGIQPGTSLGTPASNPIELLNGITRPLNNLSSGNSLSAQSWSSIGTSLSDAVTQINQASQLKMNDINADTKQKDRQFDLANTALQKAADMVSKIASAA